jgi:hypothetical protein
LNILNINFSNNSSSMNAGSGSDTSHNPVNAPSRRYNPTLKDIEKTIMRLSILQEPMFYTIGYDSINGTYLRGEEKPSFSSMKPSTLTYVMALRVNQLLEEYDIQIGKDSVY